MNSIRLLVLCTFVFLLLQIASVSRADMLRGFGRVDAIRLADGRGMAFHCQSPENAVLLIHKLARDMALSATAAPVWTNVSIGASTVPVLVRPGLGAYLVLAKGADAYCFTIPVQGDVVDCSQFSFVAPYLDGAKLYDSHYTYPYYLDKWSDKGIGTWYSPYDPIDQDPKGLADIVTPHFDYMKQNSLTAHVADGIWSRRETMRWIRNYKTPYHIQQWHDWNADLARLDPYSLLSPGSEFGTIETYYGQVSFGGDNLQQYRDWLFEQTMAPYVNDPQLVDWDEPHGEIGPWMWQYFCDYSKANRAHFVKWLQSERGYTLASLGAAWYHDAHRLARWSDVPIPFTTELLGRDPRDSVLAGPHWRTHSGDLEAGIKKGYTQGSFDDSQWIEIKCQGGDMDSIMTDTRKRFWFRANLVVPQSYLSTHRGRLYLNDLSLCEAGGQHNPDHIWLNGVDLGGLTDGNSKWIIGAKDVTSLVHVGINHIACSPASNYFPGVFYLSSKPVDTYPFADPGRNARFYDWSSYMSHCACEEERHTLASMRSLDPNRPIKIMAADDKDLFSELMSDYGAYSHNTGDEAFFRPWDRRGSYSYGIPGSAESSASMPDPATFKRWLGFFLFEGLNAFDNFINVESMMYTPAAADWQKDFPYVHLANRYDLRQPDLAIFLSDQNKRLTGGIPYTFDLGRGDLQSIGYSYAYVDEISLHKGLAAPYKVIWDDGTWMMSQQTIADLRKFVENGGTYVALQETGRNTFTARDAWPIQSLTGFKVTQVRPMSGFLSILNDQPLFNKLSGRSFPNVGKSVDYSGYNFADKCVSLEPVAPQTQAIARYRDGSIAIGMRKLGKGRVIVLGSPFWRDSYDSAGIFVPGEPQNQFVADLLSGLGLAPDVPSDNNLVWKDRYVANNGAEEYLLFWNPSPSSSQTVHAQWATRFPALSVYDPKTGQQYPAEIHGSDIAVTATLAPLESLVLAAQVQRDPEDTVGDWYAKTAQWWKASLPGKTASRPNVPLISAPFAAGEGKIVAAASVTHERLAKLSSSLDAEGDWDTRLGSIRPFYAGLSATKDQAVIYRLSAETPISWRAGGRYLLRLNLHRSNAPKWIYLNGKQVATAQQVNDARESGVDITPAIRIGGSNIVIIACGSEGAAMDANILRQSAPSEVLPLNGNWDVRQDEDRAAPQVVKLPGKFTGLFARRSVVVPLSWKGSHIFMHIADGANAPLGFYGVNNRVIFGIGYGSFVPQYMDITPWIKFGQSNEFLLQSRDAAQHWIPGAVSIDEIQLERVPAKAI